MEASQKQNRLQYSKNLSSNVITAEFYINGNFQLSQSSVSMRGLGTGSISQRRTQQCWGRTGPPGMTPTTTWKGYTDSLHAKTSSQRACLQQCRKMPCLSRKPTVGFHQRQQKQEMLSAGKYRKQLETEKCNFYLVSTSKPVLHRSHFPLKVYRKLPFTTTMAAGAQC